MNLNEAIKDMEQRLIKSLDEESYESYKSNAIAQFSWDRKEVKGTLTRLRLDWELDENPDAESIEQLTDPAEAIRLMLNEGSELRQDLEDLVENGDVVGNSNDALLKAMDGRIKRGKELKHAEIYHAMLFRELKMRKSTTEWTLFLTLYTEWE